MTTQADAIIAFILKHEGGYVNDPHDAGGETNFGISKRQYPNVDIKNLSMAQAAAIYQRDYYAKVKGDAMPAWLALLLTDFAVNAGVGTAVRLLQRLLGQDVDGVLAIGVVLLLAVGYESGSAMGFTSYSVVRIS
jgi:lysozyme family protein